MIRRSARVGETNAKVERLNRTLLDEWAYARPYRSEQRANWCTWTSRSSAT
ncbi:hypothetical protein OG390_30780 [Streptomyces sp. NBC_00996]|nr:hypothetical protein OG390_30780 [Streptomyces sp. NBC_00996]